MQKGLRTSLARVGRDAVFAGLNLDEYLALSEEEDNALRTQLPQRSIGRKERSAEAFG